MNTWMAITHLMIQPQWAGLIYTTIFRANLKILQATIMICILEHFTLTTHMA